MLTERLRAPMRCPSAQCVGLAAARDFRVCFSKHSKKDGSGKATLVKAAGQEIVSYGVLFEIALSEREALDKAEGNGYARDDAFFVVHLADAIALRATTYLALPAQCDERLVPYDWYHALILAGALQHQLPNSYVETLRRVTVQCDPEPQRCERQEALRVLQCVAPRTIHSSPLEPSDNQNGRIPSRRS